MILESKVARCSLMERLPASENNNNSPNPLALGRRWMPAQEAPLRQ